MKRVEIRAKFRRLVRDARRGTELVLSDVAIGPDDERALASLGEADVPLKVIIMSAAEWSSIIAAARAASDESDSSPDTRDQQGEAT